MRLDWLEKNGAGVRPVMTVRQRPTTAGFGRFEHYGEIDGWRVTFFSEGMSPSVREAIDAAMRADQSSGKLA
jgi:hypothetical protein